MRRHLASLLLLGLAACANTSVNQVGPASAALQPLLAAEAADANARSGAQVGSNFINRGAVVEGNTITYTVEVRRELSERTRGASRGALANAVEQSLRRDYCADATHRALVAAGGRVQTVFVDALGRRLFDIVFDRC